MRLWVALGLLWANAGWASLTQPPCQSDAVDASIQGSFEVDHVQFVIKTDRIDYNDGTSYPAWSCTVNDVLLLNFALSAAQSFEASAVKASGNYLLNYGDIEDDGRIHSWDAHLDVPLSPAGLDTLMRAGKVKAAKRL